EAGWLVFYSETTSRKGVALTAHPRAALVFHWTELERQIRVEGPVTVAPDAPTDAYWNSRPLDARIAAIASDQSHPIASRQAMLDKVAAATRQWGRDPRRPERWIGYRVWAETVELWVSQPARVHDRAVWTRSLSPVSSPPTFTSTPWRPTRLQPCSSVGPHSPP